MMAEQLFISHRWYHRFVGYIFLILLVSKRGSMYPNGAPNSACERMDPSITRTHDGGRQESKVPFKLVPTKEIVTSGERVTLTIDNYRGTSSPTFFKGFIVQAVKMNTNEILGKFIVNDNDENVKPMTCNGVKANSVTHTHNRVKSSVNLTWESPNIQEKTAVDFYFTVMTDKKSFWVRQKAEKLLYIENQSSVQHGEQPEPEAEAESTHESIDGTSSERQDDESIYSGCTTGSKGCFGFPSNCVKSQDCSMLMTYAFDATDNKYNFELSKSKMDEKKYVALGFSNDRQMGDDLVFSCSSSVSDQVKVGWNEGQSGPTPLINKINVLESSTSDINGTFVCKFTLEEEMIFNKPGSSDKVTFHLGEKYYVLLAYGPTSGDNPGYHESRIPSEDQVDLKITSEVAGGTDPKLFIQIHGTLMTIAWIALAATGMVIARYYKQTWKRIKPFKKDLWFRIHQVVMTFVVLTSIAGFVVICIVKGFLPYSIKDYQENPHPATGFAAIVCACIQPLMAFFRPHPETSKRWVFDWLHWFVGNSTYLLAICTLFLAAELPSAQLGGKKVDIILIVYVVIHVVAHLILTFQHCKVSSQ